MKKLIILSVFMLPLFAVAQETAIAPAPVQAPASSFEMDLLIGVLIAAAVLLLFVALTLLRAFKVVANTIDLPLETAPAEEKMLEYDEWVALKKQKPSVWMKLASLKPLSEEKYLIMHHEFDGIQELDNPTPAWFMVLFYVTIAFAGIYILNYEVLGYGQTQEQEYTTEVRLAAAEKAAYLAKSANNIDENSVKINKDAAVIAAGKSVFNTNCVACHGDKAQGLVGPNLTDQFWLHGGKINSVFKTIKYGVTDKGMIAWEKSLSPKQISEVANYILSLQGTNPAGAKAPQGNKE